LRKKYFLISSIIIFGLGFLLHNVYNIMPNFLTSIFFQTNESIWQHNKLIITSYLVFTLITKIYLKRDKRNIFFASSIAVLICMVLETSLFGLIYFYILETKESMIAALTTYAISIIVAQYIWTILLNKDYNKTYEIIGIILFTFFYVLLTVTTYNPIHNKIFYDYKHHTYNIVQSK